MNDICQPCIEYNDGECNGGYRLRCCTDGPIRERPRYHAHGLSEDQWEAGDIQGHIDRDEGRRR